MALSRYRLLSVGCVGTLLDRDAGLMAALKPLVARAGVPLRRSDLLSIYAAHETQSFARPHRPYSDVLADAHRQLASTWGVRCAEQDHHVFAQSVRDWPLYPDAAGALQYLQRYYKILVASNADRATLEAIGRRLDIRFDGVVSGEDAGHYKPAPAFFEQLVARARKMQIRSAQMLHAAASLPHDLQPAKSAGITATWIDRSQPAVGDGGTDYRFASLAHLVSAHQDDLRR